MPESDKPNDHLTLDIIDHDEQAATPATRNGKWRRLWLLPVCLLSLMMGGFIGIYFQPPGLRALFSVTGLEPGGGTSRPFALPAGVALPDEVADTLVPTDVIGLARLMPRGDTSVVALPFGAQNARIAEIAVQVGDTIAKGDVLATLDNLPELQGQLATAVASVAVREATLVQTRQTISTNLAVDQARLAEAQAIAKVAAADLSRTQSLFDRGFTTQAELDQAVSRADQAARGVERAEAALTQYLSDVLDEQPDVVVALRNLEAAQAELERARLDLNKGRIVAPIDGTVLDIAARPGETPGQDGVMTLGDVSQMMAEVEVHQSRIEVVKTGQKVEFLGEALNLTLRGEVRQVGLLVQQQAIVAGDIAANTDARVVKVLVALDAPDSARAARFTNLELIARIDTREMAQ